jgi:hypothetical protein
MWFLLGMRQKSAPPARFVLFMVYLETLSVATTPWFCVQESSLLQNPSSSTVNSLLLTARGCLKQEHIQCVRRASKRYTEHKGATVTAEKMHDSNIKVQ